MIISADCIEATSQPADAGRPSRVKKKKKLSSSRSAGLGAGDHVYKISKALAKLTRTHTQVTWKCLLNEILKLGSTEISTLPPNVVLIAKVNDLSSKERDQYKVTCTEDDFLDAFKLAQERKCSLSVIVKYLKNEVFENSQRAKKKYIEDVLKPNSVHMSFLILADSYTVNDEIHQGMEVFTLNSIKNVVSVLQENLSSFESYLDSFVTKSNSKKEPLDIACKKCHGNIVGTRYKCSSCDNFELCEMCEATSEQIHDQSHLFLKIKLPTQPKEISGLINHSEFITKLDAPFDLSHNLTEFKTTSIDIKEVSSPQEEQTTLNERIKKLKTRVKTIKSKNSNENEKTPKKVYHVEGGSKISKIWKIRNNGTSPWTSQLTLRRISGNIEPIEEQHILPVPLLKPGEEDIISITFKIPNDIKQETDYFSEWRFCYKEKIFGRPLNLNVTVKPIISEDVKTNKNNDLHISESDDDLSTISEDSVEYPPCFNLDIPFLQPSTSSDSKTSFQNALLIDRRLDINPVKISKGIDYNTLKRLENNSHDSTSDSADTLSASKLKTNLRIFKVKKVLPKSIKSSSTIGKYSNDLLIPIASNCMIDKIKNRNETMKTNGDRVPIPGGIRTTAAYTNNKSDPFKPSNKKSNSSPNSDEPSISKLTKAKSFSAASSSNKPKYALDQIGGLLPNVSRTFSQFCNMIANPGPSHSLNQISTSNNNRTGSNESMRNALEKLFEMGFCNEVLNAELLIKNNFDIQRTVHELFSSIGNNLFSGASPSLATSASQTGSNTAVSRENGQKPDSCFLVDSVD